MKIMIIALAVLGTALAFDLAAAGQDMDGPRFLNLPGRGDALPYSHAVVAGKTVYIAGTLGLDADTGLAPEDIDQEIRLLMEGIKAKAELAGVMAHEIGHAMHSHFSNRAQPFATALYSIFVAEVASTLNVALLFEHLLRTETDPEMRRFLLSEYLHGFRGTVFRQIMFAEFEREMEALGAPARAAQ